MAIRGPKPKPTHLKLVTGNPGRRPLNKGEAKVEAGIPDQPPHLWEEARAEWDRQCKTLASSGLLSTLDRSVFAAYCQAYAQWVRAVEALTVIADRDTGGTRGLVIKTKNGNHIQNPLVGIANKAALDMCRYAEQIGMTPSARSRIDVESAQCAQVQNPTARYFSD